MTEGHGQLEPPNEANLPGATEVLRVWLADEKHHVSLRADTFNDPATWGGILADLVLYLEVVLSLQSEDWDMTETRKRILLGFQARLRQQDEEES